MVENFIDLYELQTMLKEGIAKVFPGRVWLKAEISALKARPGGHCYLELSQSSSSGLVAKAQAVIWSSRYRFIDAYFRSVTGAGLDSGINVLVQVSVNFSQLYGLSLVVEDIDPEFTLGEREALRRQTIARLHSEGLMDLQKELAVPVLPYRLAVISASDAAGYGDFVRHLEENEYGFVFDVTLFPAQMQGADAPASMIAALDEIAAQDGEYDLVLLMRGGGAKLDLDCYDDYALAAAIARFPVPVFTAIGHERDFHICDMVACRHVKTPTALADELISSYAAEDARILSYAARLKMAFLDKINSIETSLRLLETRIRAADPRNIIKRGYVLALDSGGVPVKSVSGKSAGDEISLMFADGVMDCVVKNVKKEEYGQEK